jgi:hypothetical protein
MNMVPYTSQHVFLYGSYVKCHTAVKPQRIFHHKHPKSTIPSTTSIHKCINKVRSTNGLFFNKKPIRTCSMPTDEEVDEIG